MIFGRNLEFRFVAASLTLLLLVGCGTTHVQMPYTPTAAVSSAAVGAASLGTPSLGTPSVGIGEVVDARGKGADWIGAIRGGFGNPVKIVRSDRPVRDVVQQAFRDALAARGLLAPAGSQSREVRVTVHQLDCNHYVRNTANADFSVEVVDRATGRTLYTDRAKAEWSEYRPFSGGVFGSVEQMRAATNRVQNQAIDQLLGKPGFLAAVPPSGAARPASRA